MYLHKSVNLRADVLVLTEVHSWFLFITYWSSGKNIISPSQVFHPSIHPSHRLIDSPDPSGMEDNNRDERTLPPWNFTVLLLARSIHRENPPWSLKMCLFFHLLGQSLMLKTIPTCIQASLGGTRVVKWGIHRSTMRSVWAHMCMHVCLHQGCGGSVTICGIHSESF